jgi:hypothetical protein
MLRRSRESAVSPLQKLSIDFFEICVIRVFDTSCMVRLRHESTASAAFVIHCAPVFECYPANLGEWFQAQIHTSECCSHYA